VQRAALVNLGELSTYDGVSHGQCFSFAVHHCAQLARACICVCRQCRLRFYERL
jgi:hypothetical protein